MKRSGFTMIELIFVIVILGILAAVALPKFIGVSEQANLGKAKAYIGSLNRTVAPALWSASLANGQNGSVVTVTAGDIEEQIDTPDIGDAGAKLDAFALSAANCGAADPTLVDIGVADTSGYANADTFDVGGVTYAVRCANGNTVAAPRFWLIETAGSTILVK